MSDAYDIVISNVAKTHAVPFGLIKAIIAAESAFNPRAFRNEPKIQDASYGLMQILYKTAQWMGYSGAPEGLYDPETNIEFGTRYLKRQLIRYNGKVQDAIAAYNTGTVRKKMDGSYVNQSYVDRVLRFFNQFRARDEGEKNAGILLRSDLPQLGPVPASPGALPAMPATEPIKLELTEENKPWFLGLGALLLLMLLQRR